MLEKLVKGTKIAVNEKNIVIVSKVIPDKMNAIIVSDIMKFKNMCAIYADIISQPGNKVCCTAKLNEKTALILRDKQKMLEIGLNTEERKAIYCHEMGHDFSPKQSMSNNERIIDDELDSDSFAIEQCGISPIILESGLRKSYEYEIENIRCKPNLTQEDVDRYIAEMSARKRNIERLKSRSDKTII